MNELDRLSGGDRTRAGWGTWLFVAAAAFGGFYFASPFLALSSLGDAMKVGDSHELEKRIDFPAVRTALKEQMKVALLAGMAKDPNLKDNPFAGLAVAFAPALVDSMVDAAVTPAGIARLVHEGKLRQNNAGMKNPPAAALEGNVFSKGFVGWDDFRVEFVSGAKMWLRPSSPITWKVYKIEAPIGDF